MKFIVKGTTIRYNGDDYPESAEVDMDEKSAEKCKQYLIPVNTSGDGSGTEGKKTKENSKKKEGEKP